jgi:hypothetical protein
VATVQTPLPGDLHSRTVFSHSAGVPRYEIRVSDRLLSQGSSLSLVDGHLLSAFTWSFPCECLSLNLLFKKKKNFIYLLSFWLHWMLSAASGLSVAVGSGGCSPEQCTGCRVHGLQWLWHTSLAVVERGLSCPMACGIFLEQGLNPCPLHWQADSYPLCHQGSPLISSFFKRKIVFIWLH